MLVSTIIPLYNQEKYICKAVQSVLNQTYADIEIIIVDDCSTDNSLKAVSKKFAKTPNVIILSNEQNLGVSATRNRAVEHAKGELLAFIDADDEWATQKVEYQVQLFEQNKRVGLIHTGVSVLFDIEEKQKEFSESFLDEWAKGFNVICEELEPMNREDRLSRLLKSNGICNSSTMVRKEAFDQAGGFDTSLSLQCEDWLLWLRILAYWDAVTLLKPLTKYRFHPDSYTARVFFKKDFDFEGTRKMLHDILKKTAPDTFKPALKIAGF